MSYSKLEHQTSQTSCHYPAVTALHKYLAVEKAATLSHTPVLPLPRTSSSRLSNSYITALTSPQDLPEPTVLYLAYGSNLSASTFLGMRGIKPLSSLNVLVPSLSLTFDLPGLPYGEPCFANTKHRDSSETKSASELNSQNGLLPPSSKPLSWSKPMIGVVYEVTPEDYAHIIATEGGGASYQDILVPCHAFPDSYDPAHPVPDSPDTPAFVAHTLFAPYQPPTDPNPSHLPWSKPIFRPSPTYAQPSLRYLSLIRTGAQEHDLPAEYITYLDSLHSYTITSTRQKVGGSLFLMFWGQIIRGLIVKGPEDRNDAPRPSWLVLLVRFVFWAMWASYDGVFKAIAGDGERTVGDRMELRETTNQWNDGKESKEAMMWGKHRFGEDKV